jgi:hypothetical protein
MADYFYDGQVRRYLLQFAKIFSSWEVTSGMDEEGNKILKRIPIKMGNMSRSAAAALNNNSAASMPEVPQISYFITGIEYDQKRTQEPFFVDKMQVRQRKYNELTKTYESVQGQAFTVERAMPVPYTLRVQIDFMFSNEQQHHEFFEQVAAHFNPCMELQSTDNYIDWTSLTAVYQEGLTWDSRSVPLGTNNAAGVMSWKFYMPIWVSSPAKLKKYGVVNKIVTSIFNGSDVYDMTDDDLLMGTRAKFTPYGFKVLLIGNSLQLLPDEAAPLAETQDTETFWQAYLNQFGVIRPGISQIWLENEHMNTSIVGSVAFNPNDDRMLIFNIDADTLPTTTLDSVLSVINPAVKGPEAGLAAAANNQRYLILADIDSGTSAWGNLTAHANDIIEYNDTIGWHVSFDSANSGNTEYVKNLTSGTIFRYTNEEGWMKAYEGVYAPGNWSIVI